MTARAGIVDILYILYEFILDNFRFECYVRCNNCIALSRVVEGLAR